MASVLSLKEASTLAAMMPIKETSRCGWPA